MWITHFCYFFSARFWAIGNRKYLDWRALANQNVFWYTFFDWLSNLNNYGFLWLKTDRPFLAHIMKNGAEDNSTPLLVDCLEETGNNPELTGQNPPHSSSPHDGWPHWHLSDKFRKRRRSSNSRNIEKIRYITQKHQLSTHSFQKNLFFTSALLPLYTNPNKPTLPSIIIFNK